MCYVQLCGSWVRRVPLVQEDEEERAGEGGGEGHEIFSGFLTVAIFLRSSGALTSQAQG